MYLIYVDESGKSNFSDPENFVLSAVVVHEKDWKKYNDNMDKLKHEFFYEHHEYLDFHMNEIASSRGIFRNMAHNTRFKLSTELANLMEGLTFFSVIINKNQVKKENKTKEFSEKWAWKILFERLDTMMSEMGEDLGFITMDSENNYQDSMIRRKLNLFLHSTQNPHRIINEICFTQSEYSNLVQIADIVAWVVRREFRCRMSGKKITIKDRLAQLLYKKILPLHYSSKKNGSYYGYKIFP